MDRQEIFNKAWLGLKGQGFERSYSEVDGCMYRGGHDGRRCAIGHCIPEASYNFDMEGYSASSLAIRKVLGVERRDGEFLEALQECHDFASSPSVMEDNLRKFARDYGLTIPSDPAPSPADSQGSA